MPVRWMLLGLLLSGAVVFADETPPPDQEKTSNTETNQPGMEVNVRANVEGTYIPYRYAFVSAGRERFTFLVPEDYRVDSSDPNKVKLASPDYTAMITLGLGSGGLPEGATMNAEMLQAHVLTNYPNVTIKESQSAAANGQSAPALDFAWKTASGIARVSRTTFIPTAAGLMEFTLTASPEQFESCLPQLNLVLLTFRSGSNGHFEYVIGSKYP